MTTMPTPVIRHLAGCALAVAVASCGGTEPSNTPPLASFTASCDALECQFENTSTDGDGAIAMSAWSFGDGGSSREASPTHLYAAPGGEFTVTVAVTDDGGAVTTSSQRVLARGPDAPSPGNAAPVASFTAACDGRTCSYTDTSTDPDAGDSVVSRLWALGDGTTGETPTMYHTYAMPGGQFTVTLTVTDTRGAASATTQEVVASGPTASNVSPVASFTAQCAGRACRFTDASTDADAADSVAIWAWDFGDGSAAATPVSYHTYLVPGGQFTVTLTVTDTRGASASTTQTVVATDGPVPDRSGTYERTTPHSGTGRHSRFVIRQDGTFDYVELTAGSATTASGRWSFATSWGGWAMSAGDVILLDFQDIASNEFCGEAYGTFLLDGELGVSYCGNLINAGFEEGVYSSAPNVIPPDIPPPQAGQLVFVREGRIHRVNTDGTGLVQLTDGPSDHSPAWSPDGSRIAFARGGASGGIYTMTADGASQSRRASVAQWDYPAPTWSPDGEWIAYACLQDGDWHLCKVRATDDGSAPVRFFPRRGHLRDAAWSPDGSRIAFISDWNMFDIWFDVWVIAADGTLPVALRQHTPLTPNTEGQFQPAWSPDGQRIAVVECPWSWSMCGPAVIAVMNADGSAHVRIATVAGLASPTWSPDGQVIAFSSGNELQWISADGSQRGRILINGSDPAWRP